MKVIFNKPKIYPTNLLYTECLFLNIKNCFRFNVSIYIIKNCQFLKVEHKYTTRQFTNMNIREKILTRETTESSYIYEGNRILKKLSTSLRKDVFLPMHNKCCSFKVSLKEALKFWLLTKLNK